MGSTNVFESPMVSRQATGSDLYGDIFQNCIGKISGSEPSNKLTFVVYSAMMVGHHQSRLHYLIFFYYFGYLQVGSLVSSDSCCVCSFCCARWVLQRKRNWFSA